ncbi:hypothetical protein PHLGIDRAFT_12676 [Phlebiopsis gigantea 11061_1 CR5-6]|uniref:Uncharacterized protein n=1 Tax=Phlebiopsis gigantea (strain 11061_1 CR5-6) TaxID=745531 RepID=A0A0C3S0G1_PHLG1|nr:hypothetical protein PHLGIDRAFT_12676 [Phlebiopsis gigantea 11061_1 CR5-6]
MATEASERCTYTQAASLVLPLSRWHPDTILFRRRTSVPHISQPPHLRTQSGGYGANDEEDGLSELDADSKEAPNAAALYAFETLVRSSQRVGETLLETWRSELETLMIFLPTPYRVQAALLSLAISAFARDFHANPFWAPSFVLSFTTALFALSVRQWLGAVPDLRCPPARTAAIVRQMPNVVCAESAMADVLPHSLASMIILRGHFGYTFSQTFHEAFGFYVKGCNDTARV